MSTDRTKLVLLGTAGGPLPSVTRSGISQALVIAGRAYVVDCGSGVARQLRRVKLLGRVHQVLLTHLHSDHTCDYFNLFLLGWPILQWNPPVRVFGPGPAGGVEAFPPDDPGRPVPVHHPANPTPGLIDLTNAQFQANAYDINVRMREAGRQDLTTLVVPHEIALPGTLGAHAPDCVAPDMEPIVVQEEDDVRITAILVQHAPVFPAFAYRFDTEDGSVVISGDTTPCANLIRLAQGADILVHEVFRDRQSPDESIPLSDDARAWEEQGRLQLDHLVTSHTPLSEVGRIAAEAGVRRLVLTHFVPGDDKLPEETWLKGVTGGFDGEVVVGRDLMELTL